MKAVILGGGKGERLGSLTAETPKPMILIDGKPVLEHQLTVLIRYGITAVYVLTGYLGDQIKDYFRDGESFGVKMTNLREEFPLGTAGAVKQLEERIRSDFLLVYGDVMFDLKLDDLIAFHKEKKGAATLVVHPSDHPHDSDLVEIDDESKITRILTKPHRGGYYRNLSNAALYMLSPAVFTYIPGEKQTDFMKDIFPAMLDRSEKLYAYRTPEYIKDMGTPGRLEKVKKDFRTGKVSRLSKENKRPAIFIDRDGTLIKNVEFLHRPEDLELYEFSSPALEKAHRSDYLCIMITNQSVVARNLCDITTIHSIHNKLETLLGMEGSYLDDIYFCPHHPDSGYPGENPVYKTECECRKPKTGLIEKAVLRYNVDRESSWFIGDSTSDIQTGVNAGMNTILVRTGNGGKDGKYAITPDFVFNDIMEGVEFILEGKNKFDEAAKEIIKLVDLENPLNIITIGGLARSGKSTLVKCLIDIFERQNITVTAVSLDNWLHGTKDRTDSMTVRERYRYKSIEEDMVKLLNERMVRIRIYDSYSRTVKNGCSLTIKKPGVVIIEGVPALDIEGLRRISNVCIYCETDEQERRERFYMFYRWKDFTENQIEQLYDKRMSDEFPIIVKSKQYADIELYRDEIKVKRSL